jgi:hypothetical protein
MNEYLLYQVAQHMAGIIISETLEDYKVMFFGDSLAMNRLTWLYAQMQTARLMKDTASYISARCEFESYRLDKKYYLLSL